MLNLDRITAVKPDGTYVGWNSGPSDSFALQRKGPRSFFIFGASGHPTPPRPDIEMTRQVVTALAAVHITVHDHVIVGKNRHTSFKSAGLI